MKQKEQRNNIIPSTEFYNNVAEVYEHYMTAEDERTRAVVSNAFKRLVNSGIVLDFGGGTGLDLGWLKDNYRILFLEPSEKMRDIARSHFGNYPNICFVTDQTDFRYWSDNSLPFAGIPAGILMNFAVLNCIKDIKTLFEKFLLITRPGTIIIAAILNTSPGFLWRNYSIMQLAKLMLKKRIVYSHHNGLSHETYLHRMSDIRKITRSHYTIESAEPIAHSPFRLLVFKRT